MYSEQYYKMGLYFETDDDVDNNDNNKNSNNNYDDKNDNNDDDNNDNDKILMSNVQMQQLADDNFRMN